LRRGALKGESATLNPCASPPNVILIKRSETGKMTIDLTSSLREDFLQTEIIID